MLAQETPIRGVGIVLTTFGGVLCPVYLWLTTEGILVGRTIPWIAWPAISLTAAMTYAGVSLYRLRPPGRIVASIVIALTTVAFPMSAPASLLGLYVLNRRAGRAILSNGYHVRVELRNFTYHLRTWLFAGVIFLVILGLTYLHARLFPRSQR